VTRDEITARIVAQRLAKGLTWQELATALDRPVVWVVSALLGQHPLPLPLARQVVELLDLPPEAAPVLAAVPHRGSTGGSVRVPPTDPTIYRFYEALAVYGPALKELIHEQFGDGIMSAINFGMTLEKKSHPAGDRVVVTFDGKFLPYDWTFAQE
jgi:cyanate lyase